METIQFKNNEPYISYQKRIFDPMVWVILSIVLTVFVLIGIIIEPFVLLLALFLGLGNYFSFAERVRFYLDEISINPQENKCYIQYYDKDILKKEQIPLRNLEIKVQTIMQVKGGKEYSLCVYNNKKRVFFQRCGIGYWTKEVCEEIVEAYTMLK